MTAWDKKRAVINGIVVPPTALGLYLMRTYQTNPRRRNNFTAKRVSRSGFQYSPAANTTRYKRHKRNKVEKSDSGIGWKAVQYGLDDEKRQRVIKDLVELGDWKARKVGNEINNCKAFVSWKGGVPSALIRYCNKNRWCPMCSRRERAKRQEDLYKAIHGLSHTTDDKFSFITLTMDPSRIERHGKSCSHTFSKLRASLSKLLNRPEIRKALKGSYYAIEATKKNDTWNIHVHLITQSSLSRRELDRIIRKLWNGPLDCGFIIKTKKFHINKKSIKELVKYCLKDAGMSGKDFASFVSVSAGRRLSGSTGTIKKELSSINKKRKQSGIVPSPPLNFDMKMEDGTYSKKHLYALALVGDMTAVYCLKLIKYRAKWGYKYEIGEREKGESSSRASLRQSSSPSDFH
jgi:hypothetical protein